MSREPDTWSALPSRIGAMRAGMSSGSWEPSASMKTVMGRRRWEMTHLMASPLPRRLSMTIRAPLAVATRTVSSREWPSTTTTSSV